MEVIVVWPELMFTQISFWRDSGALNALLYLFSRFYQNAYCSNFWIEMKIVRYKTICMLSPKKLKVLENHLLIIFQVFMIW